MLQMLKALEATEVLFSISVRGQRQTLFADHEKRPLNSGQKRGRTYPPVIISR